MSKHTITAVFDTRDHAEKAVSQLKTSGIVASDITLLPAAGEATTYTDETRSKGFWASLEELFGGTEDHATYAESLRRGGNMISVRVEDADMDRVIDILEQHGSVDLDERETTWRNEGWTGGTVATGSSSVTDRSGLGLDSAGMTGLGAGALGAGALGTAAYEERRETVATAAPVVTDRAVLDRASVPAATGVVDTLREGVDDVIQVVEERLGVGKRAVSRGKVRIHSSIISREVSENVTLRDETVTVDRRVVDRPVSVAALGADPFRERVIEVEEIDEEAIIAKSAHVVEEIGIRKDAVERVETVRDTLRSTKVDIEDARTDRIATGVGASFLTEVRDDMEVVGSDGVHVGTVDHLDGGRIKLKKIDPAAGGQHHYLSPELVKSVAGKVMLSVTAAEAKTRWSA